MQVAAAGVINVGGLNTSHKYLYPDLATNDLNELERVINNIILDDNERIRIMQYAYNKVNELYSFETVKKQIQELKK